jgi:hypothetical protein
MNPWNPQDWSLTMQGMIVRTRGLAAAKALAAAAGSHIGATKPAQPNKPKIVHQTFITRRTTVVQGAQGYSGDGPPEDA